MIFLHAIMQVGHLIIDTPDLPHSDRQTLVSVWLQNLHMQAVFELPGTTTSNYLLVQVSLTFTLKSGMLLVLSW